jgi:hypothetical protein
MHNLAQIRKGENHGPSGLIQALYTYLSRAAITTSLAMQRQIPARNKEAFNAMSLIECIK